MDLLWKMATMVSQVLENQFGIFKDNGNGSKYSAFFIELDTTIDIKCVLIAFKSTFAEGRKSSTALHCHSLSICWSSRVYEGYGLCYKAISIDI
ncbi:unnamed protein product [Ilex paraguariensis]|uniref:Uncharacterized protein n=1 Tax=Ilex paraguariensis TaxID=185542 RepID=A0ABC8R0H1_9AQUA